MNPLLFLEKVAAINVYNAVDATTNVSADMSKPQLWKAHVMNRKGKSFEFQSRDNPDLALDVFGKAALPAISGLAESRQVGEAYLRTQPSAAHFSLAENVKTRQRFQLSHAASRNFSDFAVHQTTRPSITFPISAGRSGVVKLYMDWTKSRSHRGVRISAFRSINSVKPYIV